MIIEIGCQVNKIIALLFILFYLAIIFIKILLYLGNIFIDSSPIQYYNS